MVLDTLQAAQPEAKGRYSRGGGGAEVVSGTTQGGHRTGQGKAADPAVRAEIRHSSVALETTGSQELRWVSQHTTTGRAEMRGQAKSNDVPKTEASPGVLSPTPNLWAQQRELKKRAKKVSATEQHYHKLFSAAWSPLGVDALSSHTQHSPVRVGQSFITPISHLQMPVDSSHSIVSQPTPSSQWLEKSGILYVHIYLPAMGFSNWQGSPQPSTPPHPLFPGRSTGGCQRWLAEGNARWGDPTRPKGGEWHFSPPFETKLP